MTDLVQQHVAHLQGLILAQFPDTKFKLEPSEHEDIWHFSVYTPEGAIRMPPEVLQQMMGIWHEQKITIITTVYPMALFAEAAENG